MSKWYDPALPGAPLQARPWLSPKAVEVFQSLLSPDMHVIEFGAGGSTLWLAERVKTVTSYEPNREWHAAMQKRTPKNVLLRFGTIFQYMDDSPRLADLLFIDGEPVERRADWLAAVVQIVRPGGIIVLDNANRPEYVEQRFELLKHCEPLACVNGNEHETLFLVTEFYKLKG